MGRPKQFDPDVAVDRAMGVFWRKGYAATTPQDLVDEIGIGKGSLYHAFGSKRGLFELALRRYRDNHELVMAELLHGREPVRVRLRAALERLVQRALAPSDQRGCLAVNTATELAGRDAEAAAVVRQIFIRTEDVFRAVIEEGQRRGEIAPDRDASALAGLLLHTVVGLQVVARTGDASHGLHGTVDALMEAL
ncbi:TetR/AcrR family transcriptional regulator [Streptomyces sp. SAJ15]|uniref:TetR/AcrR family transcriptional regulator n=1 Tax=Streptomyces sp. SAJ15 TaxID=2011095 RepID=UPI0011864546|nr:TetR/AcrR family transcriptional regulator [Streptomyces sp. SAJ15]TVL92930.1 TetR family transcriptional regulator [Streptomyces sp. SAJ15]